MAVKYSNTFAIPRLTMRFNVVDSEHCVLMRADGIEFVVVVHNNNNINFYLAHTHEIHINALYNTNNTK